MVPNILIYCLEFNIILFVFFLFYILILKKETHFQLNRLYLLSSIVLSFVIPLINISLHDEKLGNPKLFQSFISFLQEYKNIYYTGNFSFQRSKSTYKIKGKEHSHVKNPLVSRNYGLHSTHLLLLLLYCSVSIFLLCKVMCRMYTIMTLVLKNPRKKKNGITYVYLNKSISPFSFLQFIFLPYDINSNKNRSMILTHERLHIRQFHSIDILILEGVSILFWFNPIIWIYKRLLRDLHEYLADSKVLQYGYNQHEYQAQLLKQGLINNGLISCNFSPANLTKRACMISKNRSSHCTKFKLLFIIPIIVIMICMFSTSYSKVDSQKKSRKLNELRLSLAVSDSIVELCAIGGCLPIISYTKFNNEYCITDIYNNIKYGLFSDNDKVLLNGKREIVTKIALGDTVYEGYFYNEKAYRNPSVENSFLNNNPIVITKDFTFIRKPFPLFNEIENILFNIRQRFGKTNDITSIILKIDDSVSIELKKKTKDIALKTGFRNITIL